jgi:hypothetical protein
MFRRAARLLTLTASEKFCSRQSSSSEARFVAGASRLGIGHVFWRQSQRFIVHVENGAFGRFDIFVGNEPGHPGICADAISCRMNWSKPHDTPGFKMRLAFESSAKWYHVQTWLVKDEPRWGREEFWNEMGVRRSSYRFTAFWEQHRTRHPVMRADLLIDRATGRACKRVTTYNPFRHLRRVSETATGKCRRMPPWNTNPFGEDDNPFEQG